jgi:hypothetical protein
LNVEYDVEPVFTFSDATESLRTELCGTFSASGLLPQETEVCCEPDQVFRLQRTGDFQAYRVSGGRQNFAIDVTVTQGATVRHFVYSSAGSSAITAPVASSVSMSLLASDVPFFAGELLVAQRVAPNPPFSVPIGFFGTGANHLGISTAQYVDSRQELCGLPPGAVTSLFPERAPILHASQLSPFVSNGLRNCSVRNPSDWQRTLKLQLVSIFCSRA